MVDDIFTLARDRGAAAAMLFSLTARSCSVNAEYVSNFEKPLDVYSSGNLQGARLIESQFRSARIASQTGLSSHSRPNMLIL